MSEAADAARRDIAEVFALYEPRVIEEALSAVHRIGRFKRGDRVKKIKGYPFRGWVVSAFTNRDGGVRYAVEHETERGMLHIYSEEQLEERLV